MFKTLLRKVFKTTERSRRHDATAIPASSMFIARKPAPGLRVHWAQSDTARASSEPSSFYRLSPPPIGLSPSAGVSCLLDQLGSLSWSAIANSEADQVLSPSASMLSRFSSVRDHSGPDVVPATSGNLKGRIAKRGSADDRAALGIGRPPKRPQTVPGAVSQESKRESSQAIQRVLDAAALERLTRRSPELYSCLSSIPEEEEEEEEGGC